jgi:hypothetical protein
MFRCLSNQTVGVVKRGVTWVLIEGQSCSVAGIRAERTNGFESSAQPGRGRSGTYSLRTAESKTGCGTWTCSSIYRPP